MHERPRCAVELTLTISRWRSLDGHQATLTTDRFLAPRWDVQHCLNCGGKLTIIAVILESAVIERILTHLGLRARAPPQAPARGQARQAA